MIQSEALQILRTGANVFLTGEPGAGKTHTINEYVSYLRSCGVEVAITASTGIAATHIGGMTIHSWSGIGIRKTLTKYDLDKISTSEYVTRRVAKAKVLVIDEVSMLGPNTIDMVDAVCREVRRSTEAFGGLQVIFVGDFFQLPPITKRDITNIKVPEDDYNQDALFEAKPLGIFAYEASSWERAHPITCYLSEQYRQDDDVFLSILSSIRSNTFDEDMFEHLEARRVEVGKTSNKMLKLFSRNVDVDSVNSAMLEKIKEEKEFYRMVGTGRDIIVETLKKGCLSPDTLVLKLGAEVMCTKNNQKEGYVNGTLGTIVGFASGTRYPIVENRNGRKFTVEPAEWALEENGKVRASISQIPLRLAWAITVHKSQGMSLDEAVMDLSDVFEYGQGYVALSRVRRLSGLHLLGWNRRAFEVHPQIFSQDQIFKEQSSAAEIEFTKLDKKELQKMHDNFIRASGGVVNPSSDFQKKAKEKKVVKVDTKELTLDMWNEGKDIVEIAKIRKLKESTIFTHIEELVVEEKIPVGALSRILDKKTEKALPAIHKAFHKLDTRSLSAVFEHFDGKHSYDTLRLARLFLEK
ncbi:MAG: AAA family ATPase [Candidatus Nomurabacteria bacterium]|nr:AAA family ATPase [Candidatus Nomurabacteria bacterium]